MTQQEEMEPDFILAHKKETEPQIIQIMPAQPGWEAVWGNIQEPEKGEAGYFSEPVVCWALVEASDGHRYVTAMAPDLESSELKMILETDNRLNFLGYANPGSSPNWTKMASNRRTEKKSSKA
ncbi:MAG: hypothetical protein M3Z24_13615 [Chloroflexota bacterium]|nr:hypothetical protein [Chloroflexota bacterium]